MTARAQHCLSLRPHAAGAVPYGPRQPSASPGHKTMNVTPSADLLQTASGLIVVETLAAMQLVTYAGLQAVTPRSEQ